MSAKPIFRKAVPALAIAMALLAASLAWCVPEAYAGDAPATQYVDRHWENGQVVSEAKTQGDVAWMTDGHLKWHDGWWYTRDLDELVISDRVSVDDGATANLILMDGKTIKFENGIHVGPGSTLNIYGQAQGTGKLVVGRSEADTAAIGGNAGESCGTINVYGGTIEVTGGSHSSNGGAGIGAGGSASNEGAINVYGGTVASAGGANAAGIGGGANGGHGGAIAIYGGNVTANGDSGAAGIGGGEGGSGTGTFIYGGEVHAKGGSSSADGGAGIGSGGKGGREGVVGGNVYVFGGSVYAAGGADAAGIGGGNEVSGGYVIVNGDGAYVEAQGGTLGAGIGGGQNGDGGTVEIRKGTVKATGGSDGAGIGGGDSGSGGTITIEGGSVEATGGSYASGIGGGDADGDGRNGGTVNIAGGAGAAKGGDNAAGIGGGEGAAGGNITIAGGSVTATGGANGAGIGGGDCGEGGTITITGGDKIIATGGANAAGIGGGNDAVWTKIEITGGTVEATGGDYAAGIGSGDRDSLTTGGNIVISGGDVKATGGKDGAGIGGGEDCTGGNITLNGGTITATGGSNEDASPDTGGAGIGGGDGADGGTITITGDAHIKKATGGIRSAAIGGGADAGGGTINISGGLITEAQGGYRAAGIGGGYGESGGTITISGGTIIKTVGGGDHQGINYHPGGAGIGGGYEGNGGAITISGGDINATGSPYSAGIGGGYKSESGTILITGGKVNGNGGYPSGAGIGSGAHCAGKDKTTVDITINGGKIHGYAGGRYQYKDTYSDTTYWSQEGAAIGVGGNETKQKYYGGTAGYGEIKIDKDSFFNGKIVFNGGTVTTGGPLGASVDTCLNEDSVKGEIEFNGATVTVSRANTNSFLEGNCLVYADNITIKEDSSLHQRVSYEDPGSDVVVVASGDRTDTLKRVNTFSVKVEPCPHEGGNFVDKGDIHYVNCLHCDFVGNAPHAYGEPTWAWSDDHLSATATFTCGSCGHTERVDATVTSEQVGDQTLYTATATFQGKSYTETHSDKALAEFTYSLSLEDCIDINFYAKDLAGEPSKYTVSYGPGEEGSAGWTDKVLTRADENKIVVAGRAAKEMGDEVHVVVKYDGAKIKDQYYSVKGYCDAVIKAGKYDAGLVELCKATLDYGRYAQEAFNYKADSLVNGGTDVSDWASVTVPDYGADKEDGSELVTGVTLSLVTTSKTQLVARFRTTAASPDGFSATVDGVDVTPGLALENGKIKVAVTGIAAKDLDAKKAIVLTDPKGGTYTFEVSPVDYMGLAVSKSSQVDLNRAFYNYHLKAKAYQGPGAVLTRAPSGGSLMAATGL